MLAEHSFTTPPMSLIEAQAKDASGNALYDYAQRGIDGTTQAYSGRYVQTRMSCLNSGDIDEWLTTTELSKATF